MAKAELKSTASARKQGMASLYPVTRAGRKLDVVPQQTRTWEHQLIGFHLSGVLPPVLAK